MIRCLNSTRALMVIALIAASFVARCGDNYTVAEKSEKAFKDAKRKGLPIARNGHGGHTNMSADDMKGTDGGDASTAANPSGMGGMDHSQMSGMKGMDMSGSKGGGMKGMDMSGSKSGGMKGMDMSGMKSGGMKGMDMSGMKMSPVVPQPTALQARSGETAATLAGDPLDAPDPSALASARSSADMNEMTMSMGSYVQHDAGRATSGSVPVKGMEPGMSGTNRNAPVSPDPMTGMKHDVSQPHAPSGPKTSNVVYVCPSHPEIVRDRPGKCPLDGTTLVKKEKG